MSALWGSPLEVQVCTLSATAAANPALCTSVVPGVCWHSMAAQQQCNLTHRELYTFLMLHLFHTMFCDIKNIKQASWLASSQDLISCNLINTITDNFHRLRLIHTQQSVQIAQLQCAHHDVTLQRESWHIECAYVGIHLPFTIYQSQLLQHRRVQAQHNTTCQASNACFRSLACRGRVSLHVFC
jgi:hypothetical protein